MTEEKRLQDLPQNELPEIKDSKPTFYKNQAENLSVENKNNLSTFLHQISKEVNVDQITDQKDIAQFEDKIKKLDCKEKKAVLLYISKRILSPGDKLKLIRNHSVFREKLQEEDVDKMEEVIKNLNKEETDNLFSYLLKNSQLEKMTRTNKISKLIKELT